MSQSAEINPSPQNEVTLQVLICAYGPEGMKRVLAGGRPEMPGVQYLVSWQQPDSDEPVPECVLSRNDFRVEIIRSRGVAKNRNNLLRMATSPLLLFSDDDVVNSPAQLQAVIEQARLHPDDALLCFKIDYVAFPKYYHDFEFLLSRPAKGFYMINPELMMRRSQVQGHVWFNEHFGIGAEYPIGEEDVFMEDCRRRGIDGHFVPIEIGRHDDPTSAEKIGQSPAAIKTKGAIFTYTHPFSWPARMIVHAWRQMHRYGLKNALSYLRNWFAGAMSVRGKDLFSLDEPEQVWQSITNHQS